MRDKDKAYLRRISTKFRLDDKCAEKVAWEAIEMQIDADLKGDPNREAVLDAVGLLHVHGLVRDEKIDFSKSPSQLVH